MDKYKRLVSNTMLFAISTFSSRFLFFIMAPLFSYWFDTAEMNVWLRWLIPALNPAERAALIGGLPPEARAPVLETARRLLDDSAWVKLCLAQAPTAVSAA